MTSYRDTSTGKRLAIWLIVRLLGFVAFLTFAVLSYQRGKLVLTLMEGAFALSFLLHLIDLFIRLCRAGNISVTDDY